VTGGSAYCTGGSTLDVVDILEGAALPLDVVRCGEGRSPPTFVLLYSDDGYLY